QAKAKQKPQKNSSTPALECSSTLSNLVTAKSSQPIFQQWRNSITTALGMFFSSPCRNVTRLGSRHVRMESARTQSQARREGHHDLRSDGEQETQKRHRGEERRTGRGEDNRPQHRWMASRFSSGLCVGCFSDRRRRASQTGSSARQSSRATPAID